MELKIDLRWPSHKIENVIRETLRHIDRDILLGILQKMQGVDINHIRQESIQIGQNEGYRMGYAAAKKELS